MAIDDLNEGAKELLGTFGEYRNAVRASAEELGRQTNQLSEISDIQWVTKEESYSKIRKYNKTKYEIISPRRVSRRRYRM